MDASERAVAGRLCYGGIEYDGKHPALISDETFYAVQTILGNRRLAGDRSWKRQQYLKGTVFCHRCGERLGFAHSTGRGGEYVYFFCLGRHRRRTDCDLPYLPADAVEAAVLQRWADVRFTDRLRDELQTAVDLEFTTMRANDVRLLATQRKRVANLERQKQKLIDAYLAEAIPVGDIKARQQDIQRELIEAHQLIDSASAEHDEIRRRLDLAIQLMERADHLYRACSDEERQSLNQIVFQTLYIDIDEFGTPAVADALLNPEFASLVELARRTGSWSKPPVRGIERTGQKRDRRHYRRASGRLDGTKHGPAGVDERKRNESTPIDDDRGSNLNYLAEEVGFEPTVPVKAQHFSRVSSSTTPALFRVVGSQQKNRAAKD